MELLLCYTTEFDTEMSREIRIRCADPSNYRQILKILPIGMDIERQVLSALVAGKDTIGSTARSANHNTEVVRPGISSIYLQQMPQQSHH